MSSLLECSQLEIITTKYLTQHLAQSISSNIDINIINNNLFSKSIQDPKTDKGYLISLASTDIEHFVKCRILILYSSLKNHN